MAQTKVSIHDMKFDPATVTIAVGDTVVWTNNSGMFHTVVPDNHSFPSSGNIGRNGGTYSHTFTTAGSIPYHCEIHAFMKGTVTVK
jgi:plastocyanin